MLVFIAEPFYKKITDRHPRSDDYFSNDAKKSSIQKGLRKVRPKKFEPLTLGSEEAHGRPAKKLESRDRNPVYHDHI
jgi:hypothetical protein